MIKIEIKANISQRYADGCKKLSSLCIPRLVNGINKFSFSMIQEGKQSLQML